MVASGGAFSPNRSPRNGTRETCAGFSLLELLIVVLIIGLGATIVTIALGDNKPQELRNNARDFANFTSLVEDEAVLSREPWGVQVYRIVRSDNSGVDKGRVDKGDGSGDKFAYRFVRLTDRGWLPDHPLDVPNGAEFADNVIVELEVDGAPYLIEPLAPAEPDATADKKTNHADEANKKSAYTPTIWLAPGGDVTPFEMRLHFLGDERGPIVRSDALGRITLEVADDEQK